MVLLPKNLSSCISGTVCVKNKLPCKEIDDSARKLKGVFAKFQTHHSDIANSSHRLFFDAFVFS